MLEDFEPENPESVKIWLKDVIRDERKVEGDIIYILTSDEHLHAINTDFLQHDTFTDIITFGTSLDEKIISGEIYISIDRIKENAGRLNQPVQNELSRVMVHGILHLIGYDDKTVQEKAEMTAKEDYYLNLLP